MLRLWVALFAFALIGAPALGAETVRPFVPGYWNTDTLPDKPDLSTLGAIRFVTTNDYPPFGFTLANGAAAGFDVDVARALCNELKVTCTVQARRWDAIVPAVTSGQADAAIASLAIKDVPPGGLAFTGAYYRTPARFVVRSGTELPSVGPDALAGKRIGVVAGSAHQAYLRLFFPKAIGVAFASVEAVRAALKSGAIDAAFGDGVTWATWLNGTDAANCCRFEGGAYTESRFFGRGAGIAVRATDETLRRALDYALARIAAEGIYGDIYLKYFPLGLY